MSPAPEPHPSRLAADHPQRVAILSAHEAAVARGDAGYVDPGTGLFVFTAAYLTDRGHCCDTGCRHCPYAWPTDRGEPVGDP